MTDRRYRDSVSRPIPVWNGILEHRQRIDTAIWEFLWLLDRITEDRSGMGIVLGAAPVKIAAIAKDLAFHKWTVRQHLQTLKTEGYINLRRTPYGFVIEVRNSRKFGIWRPSERVRETLHSDAERVRVSQTQSEGFTTRRVRGNPRYKEDAAVTQQKDAASVPLPAAPPKPEDSVWGFLEIHPCGPLSFRSVLETGWAIRNGGPYSTLIGDALDAWEATEGQLPRGCAPLFRALEKLREHEKRAPGPGAVMSEPIRTLTPEEIPA